MTADKPHRFHFMRRRPPWWPENEPWPPQRRFGHYPFFRQLGCFFIGINLAGFAIFVAVIISVLRALGILSTAPDTLTWVLPFGLGLGFFILMVLFAGVFVFSMRRILTPLDKLVEASERVAEGDYSVQVDERGPRSVRSLTHAFNNMASRLNSTDAQRRNLLADVTHELRTPLTVIQGNLEGMLDGVYPADQANLRALLDETNLLARLIDDLRTLALAESGALQLKKEPTDLAALITDVASAFQPQADADHIALTVEASDDIPWVNVDPGRIRQVLTNLLANALRYTPSDGKVCVRYTFAESYAVIEVSDTGIGIAPEDLPHVFERFYKSTDSGGMGLGLAIAKHLVEAHGGTIKAESNVGKGTMMRITFPIEM